MRYLFFILLFSICCLTSCDPDDEIICTPSTGDLSDIIYNPQPYELPPLPFRYPEMDVPSDNPLTIDGVELGRHLFYDPILSVDSTIACASCHLATGGFTDNKLVSQGVDGALGTRSAMTIIDAGFFIEGLFWDGRVQTLEEQALLPVEDAVELAHQWGDVEVSLRNHATYPTMFKKAFDITNTSQITRELTAKAIAQFERSVVSLGKSRYDLQITNQIWWSESEQNGHDIFFGGLVDTTSTGEGINLPDGECHHCHNKPLFSNNDYFNNGIDSVNTLLDFADFGRGVVTGSMFDNGKFRAPTLRNIEYTAPYMHDGRFNTLEDVIEHYNTGGHDPGNVEFLRKLDLTDENKADLLAFLLSLSDTTTLNYPAYQNPFE